MTLEPEVKIEERDADHGAPLPKPVIKIEADDNDQGIQKE